MGSPKALLQYGDSTFLDRLMTLFAVRCSPVIVVLGAAAEQIRNRSSVSATYVINPDYSRGQTSSMQCGLRALPPGVEGVLFTLVDHPAVEAATIDALLMPPRPLIRVPRYQSRRGHPVWFARQLVAEFLALAPDAAASDVVHAHRSETEYVDVADQGILADIDDPASYRALTGGEAR